MSRVWGLGFRGRVRVWGLGFRVQSFRGLRGFWLFRKRVFGGLHRTVIAR